MNIAAAFPGTAALVAALTISLSSCTAVDRNPDVAPYGSYAEGLIGSIKPEGWIEEFLDRQVNGLTGHKDALAYPYDTGRAIDRPSSIFKC